MKFSIKKEVLSRNNKMYGTTTIGSRGQVVIPVEARKDLDLKPGDQLVVMGKFGKALGLIKADQLTELIDTVMAHIPSPVGKKLIKQHMGEFLSHFNNPHNKLKNH